MEDPIKGTRIVAVVPVANYNADAYEFTGVARCDSRVCVDGRRRVNADVFQGYDPSYNGQEILAVLCWGGWQT